MTTHAPHPFIMNALPESIGELCRICDQVESHELHAAKSVAHTYIPAVPPAAQGFCAVCGQLPSYAAHATDNPVETSGVFESLHTCASCPYSVDMDIDPLNIGAPTRLYCRARPPVGQMVSPGPGNEVGLVSLWPTVKPSDWCGLHPELLSAVADDMVLKAREKYQQ